MCGSYNNRLFTFLYNSTFDFCFLLSAVLSTNFRVVAWRVVQILVRSRNQTKENTRVEKGDESWQQSCISIATVTEREISDTFRFLVSRMLLVLFLPGFGCSRRLQNCLSPQSFRIQARSLENCSIMNRLSNIIRLSTCCTSYGASCCWGTQIIH